MKKILFLLIILYTIIIYFFQEDIKSRPDAIKVGYVPNSEIVKIATGEFRYLFSSYSIINIIFYFGEITGLDGNFGITPEYSRMYNNIIQSIRIDPYNQDTYYFSQALFTWEVGRIKEVNKVLEYGMKYRKWDWKLPYWIGFNSAYFLKDYQVASQMYMRAGELSGEPLFKRLAGRYLQEAGNTQMAIDYLMLLEKESRNPAIKETFSLRIAAFEAVLAIEQARDRFAEVEGRFPGSIDELSKSGYLAAPPVDPYGGTFYLDENGQVRSTSKFSFSTQPLNPAPKPSSLPEPGE